MSKILYFFIFISNLSIAQNTYSHYINETSVWRYEAHKYLTGGSTGGGINSVAYVTEYIDGTINFNGYTYYKKYQVFIRFGTLSPTYGPTYIREDSNGKFYSLDISNGAETEYFDNNSIQSIQNGTPINNSGNIDPPTSCTATISYITVDGLNLKRVEGIGYKIEGIGGIYKDGMCTGITYSCFHCPADLHPNDYELLYSYTKNGSTYIESSTGGDISNYPIPSYLNLPEYNAVSIKIFPNPTHDKINIQSNSKIEVLEVFDVQGRKLENIILNDFETKFDFSNYQNGTYFFKFNTELGMITKKIIKK